MTGTCFINHPKRSAIRASEGAKARVYSVFDVAAEAATHKTDLWDGLEGTASVGSPRKCRCGLCGEPAK
jgi:hypothetical protein